MGLPRLFLLRSYCVPGMAHLPGSPLGLHGVGPASRSGGGLTCIHVGFQVSFLEDWSNLELWFSGFTVLRISPHCLKCKFWVHAQDSYQTPQVGQGLRSAFNKPSLVILTQVVGSVCFVLRDCGLGEG